MGRPYFLSLLLLFLHTPLPPSGMVRRRRAMKEYRQTVKPLFLFLLLLLLSAPTGRDDPSRG